MLLHEAEWVRPPTWIRRWVYPLPYLMHALRFLFTSLANISSHRRYIHTLYTRSSIEIIIFLPWWLLSHRKMMASSKSLLLPFALVVLLAEAQPPVTTPVFTENYGQAVSSKRCYVYSLFTQHCASVPCPAFRALTNVRTNIASSCSARACFERSADLQRETIRLYMYTYVAGSHLWVNVGVSHLR